MSELLPFFIKARSSDGAYRVPGGELLWLEVDGHGTVGVRSREAYLNTDGTLVPGVLESPVKTDLFFTRYPGEPIGVRPLVCEACGDTGVSPDYNTAGDDTCYGCHGHGEKRNLYRCSECGEFSLEVLPVHPRAELNHELLLPRAHVSCSVESLLSEMPFRFPASPADLDTAGLCAHCLAVGERP